MWQVPMPSRPLLQCRHSATTDAPGWEVWPSPICGHSRHSSHPPGSDPAQHPPALPPSLHPARAGAWAPRAETTRFHHHCPQRSVPRVLGTGGALSVRTDETVPSSGSVPRWPCSPPGPSSGQQRFHRHLQVISPNQRRWESGRLPPCTASSSALPRSWLWGRMMEGGAWPPWNQGPGFVAALMTCVPT